MTDDDTPDLRPGYWSDARRAREGQRHRQATSPRGVVIAPIDHEHTPVWNDRDPQSPLTIDEGEQLIRYVKVRSDDNDLEARIATLERDVEPLRALRKWLWGSSIAAVLALAAFFRSEGNSEGEQHQRLRQVEQFVEELRRDQREIERALNHHSSASPATPPDAVSSATEGHQP